MSAWLALLAAGMLEIAWAFGLKYSDGLTRFWTTKGEIEGKGFRVLGVHGPDEAVVLVRQAGEAASKA